MLPLSFFRPFRHASLALLATIVFTASLHAGWDDWVDGLRPHLRGASADGTSRWRLSGRLALGARAAEHPVADLVYHDADTTIVPAPVLQLFLDAEVGSVYLFAHGRADRGFDARDIAVQARLEEWALRWRVPGASHLTLQGGKFATVFGSWAQRHAAWDYPFATAPLAQESLVGLWDVKGLPAAAKLSEWPHLIPLGDGAAVASDEWNRIPIMWGPVYAFGAAILWSGPKVDFAIEAKNTGLSSRPSFWDDNLAAAWRDPALAARVAWHPSPTWNLGASIAQGNYLRPEPESVAPGYQRSDYEQTTFGLDATYAWRRWQVWVEAMTSRFTLPGLGHATAHSVTVEGKYRVNVRWAAAARLGWQDYAPVHARDGSRYAWGRDTWRLELGPSIRLAAHAQLQVFTSVLHERPAPDPWQLGAAANLVLRF